MAIRIGAGVSVAAFLAALVLAAPPLCQGQSQDQKPAEQPAAQPQSPQQDTDSVAEAARKAKADKPKNAPKKVYTTEDLASSRGAGGVSVVGDKDSGANDNGAAEASKALGKAGMATGGSGSSGAAGGPAKDEAYWRGRAQTLRDQMAQVDAEIDKLQDEIKKGGNAGFDVQSGLANNTVGFEDRNTRLKRLQDKKADIQRQIDALEDEARKADVPSSWIH